MIFPMVSVSLYREKERGGEGGGERGRVREREGEREGVSGEVGVGWGVWRRSQVTEVFSPPKSFLLCDTIKELCCSLGRRERKKHVNENTLKIQDLFQMRDKSYKRGSYKCCFLRCVLSTTHFNAICIFPQKLCYKK